MRVSTAEQVDSRLGLDAQRQALVDEARRRGLELVRVCADEGVSARARVRPGLEAALAALDAGEADALVVSKLDRLARSLRDYVRLLERSDAGRWTLIAGNAPDATSPMGSAMRGIAAVFSELERDLIAERTREAMAAARARGIRLGRPPLIAPETVEAVLALRRRRRRATLRELAFMLESARVPAPAGGQRWYPEAVRRILAVSPRRRRSTHVTAQ